MTHTVAAKPEATDMDHLDTAAPLRHRRSAAAVVAAAAAAALGLMHFALDGLTSIVMALQPVIAARTGAEPATLGVVVAVALASASLLQPLAAHVAHRHGERRTAAAGALLAALGYGALPAVGSVPLTVAAVAVGGAGSAFFHPAAGALVARAAGAGREPLVLAGFSAAGTAGAALVPVAVVSSVGSLGWAAAVPVAAGLLVLAVTLRVGAGSTALGQHARTPPSSGADRGRLRLVVAAAALVALAGVTAGATAPVLVAQDHGPTHPAVAWVVASYSAAGAVGGILLAFAARRVGARAVLLPAVAAGTVAAMALPALPLALAFLAVVVAGAGLAGSLPLLVAHARRPGETSAAGAVGRVLGLGAGLGSVGYAGVGLAQASVGYGAALSATVALAGALALVAAHRLCASTDPADCHDALDEATSRCSGGACACACA